MELSRTYFNIFSKFDLLAEIMTRSGQKMRFLDKFAYDVLREPPELTPSCCAHNPHGPPGTFG